MWHYCDKQPRKEIVDNPAKLQWELCFLVTQTWATSWEQHKIPNGCSFSDHCLYCGLKSCGSCQKSRSMWLHDYAIDANNLMHKHKGSKWWLAEESYCQPVLRWNVWLWNLSLVCACARVLEKKEGFQF